MGKKQYLAIAVTIIVTTILYLFANTKPTSKQNTSSKKKDNTEQGFSANSYISQVLSSLSKDTAQMFSSLSESIQDDDKAIKSIVPLCRKTGRVDLEALYRYQSAIKFRGDTALLDGGNMNMYIASTAQNPELSKICYNNAIELFTILSNKHPKNDLYKVYMAQAMVEGKPDNPMEGIGMLRSIAESNPNQVEAQLALGRFAIMSNQTEKAITRLEKVLSLQPQNVEALVLMAEIKEKSGDKTAVIKLLEKAIKATSDKGLKEEIQAKLSSLK